MKLKYIYQPLILFLSLLTIVSLFSMSLTTTAVAAPPIGPDKLADFEAGLPSNWFTFFGGSSVTTTAITVGDADALASDNLTEHGEKSAPECGKGDAGEEPVVGQEGGLAAQYRIDFVLAAQKR